MSEHEVAACPEEVGQELIVTSGPPAESVLPRDTEVTLQGTGRVIR